jgi:hypothetical protein
MTGKIPPTPTDTKDQTMGAKRLIAVLIFIEY